MESGGVVGGEGRQHSPSLSFTLPIPPSMNSLYGINYRTRSVYLTNDARYWKSKAKLLIPKFNCNPDCKVSLNLDVRSEWYFKNGKMKKQDVHNLIKVVADAISEKCGFDDSQIWSFSANKVQSTEQTVAVTMGIIYEESISKGSEGSVKESSGAEVQEMGAKEYF